MEQLPTLSDWNFSSADVNYIAWLLDITPGRVRQVIRGMKLRPCGYVEGAPNRPVYSLVSAKRIAKRKTKPGPKRKGKR